MAFALFAWNILANAQESDERYIEVTGSSEIEVVPDEIHFLIQIKEYWEEEYTGKSKKEEDFRTKVPLTVIEKDLRKSLRKIGISDEAIRTQEVGDYWRQRGKEFLIGKQLDIRLTDFEQINSIIRSVNTWGIESMRIGELKHKDLPMYRKKLIQRRVLKMGQIKSRPEQEKVRQGRKASSQPAAVQRKQASEAGRRATLCERAIRYRRSSGGSTMIFPMRKRSKRQTV